ncbi:hypothetical protein NL676_004232 [Syzygium grande]|nr:hypothetical protein NL676_004232 [Syzygium grande]
MDRSRSDDSRVLTIKRDFRGGRTRVGAGSSVGDWSDGKGTGSDFLRVKFHAMSKLGSWILQDFIVKFSIKQGHPSQALSHDHLEGKQHVGFEPKERQTRKNWMRAITGALMRVGLRCFMRGTNWSPAESQTTVPLGNGSETFQDPVRPYPRTETNSRPLPNAPKHDVSFSTRVSRVAARPSFPVACHTARHVARIHRSLPYCKLQLF